VCSTSRTYGAFLQQLLAKSVATWTDAAWNPNAKSWSAEKTAALIDASEVDYSGSLSFDKDSSYFGTYGFGHFLLCRDAYSQHAMFPEECARRQRHGDPGLYGFFGILNRRYNYWVVLGAQEDAEGGSGIPEYLIFGAEPYL
jgi:hypothetical protein